jgi:hypothetical protein
MNDLEQKILIAITSLIVGGFIGYYIRRLNLRYQEFLRASKEFRDAFAPALVELDPINDVKEGYTQDTFSFNIVIKYFDRQKLAVQVFSDYLSTRKKRQLNDAWQEYAYPHHNEFPNEFNEIGFDYKTFNPAEEPDIREKIRNRIKKIISFGKY